MEIKSLSRVVREPYRAALNGDWDNMKSFYLQNREAMNLPLTVTNDTPIHFAVFSGTKSPLEDLLKIAEDDACSKRNDMDITPLHEAAAIGNIEAAKILVDRSEEDLDAKTKIGETPMYRAAAFGMIEMVMFLASQVQRSERDLDIQRNRYDNTSILHSAIHGQHFETALWLLRNDKILGDIKDSDGRTCLQLLANMPTAFKSGYPMSKFEALLYSWIPVEDKDDTSAEVHLKQGDDLEWGSTGVNYLHQSHCSNIFGATGWLKKNKTWKEKKKHESAMKLAKILIENDTTWELTHTKPDIGIISLGRRGLRSETLEYVKNNHEQLFKETMSLNNIDDDDNEEKNGLGPFLTPLHIATSTGIVEIVKEIIQVHPQAVEHVNHLGQNIMHVAIRHRQLEIFSLVQQMRIPMAIRLYRKIDNSGSTLLHHAANMKYCDKTSHNSALKLQDELRWFERVQELIPSHYVMHHNKKDETAEDIFERTHKELLKDAADWLKRTSESCSLTAVLIATVAFTASYSVPGGVNDITGLPILLHQPFFLVFIVMNVLSLIFSLTSVVMFISILTSPFRFHDFRHSIPRKLTLAFTSLFFSVMMTMLAFSATVILLVHMPKLWTATLVYTIAFVPVMVFALMQFPLYVGFMGTIKFSLRAIKNILPLNFFLRLFPTVVPSFCKCD